MPEETVLKDIEVKTCDLFGEVSVPQLTEHFEDGVYFEDIGALKQIFEGNYDLLGVLLFGNDAFSLYDILDRLGERSKGDVIASIWEAFPKMVEDVHLRVRSDVKEALIQFSRNGWRTLVCVRYTF